MYEKIAVLFPTAPESAPFSERYPGKADVYICGVGQCECAAAAARIFADHRPDAMILAGIAGAYHFSGMGLADVVAVRQENCADLGTLRSGGFLPLPFSFGGTSAANYYTDPHALYGRMHSVTSNTVAVAGTKYLNRYFTDADIENMEGAAFFAVCRALGIPFAELRAISNIVGAPPADWNIPDAASNLADALAETIDCLRLKA